VTLRPNVPHTYVVLHRLTHLLYFGIQVASAAEEGATRLTETSGRLPAQGMPFRAGRPRLRGAKDASRPPKLTTDHQLVLNEVWYFLNERRRWPTFAELDQRLYRNCDLQIDDMFATIPRGLLHHVVPVDTEESPETCEVALTVAGVHATGRGRRELDVFLEAVVFAAEIQRDYEPSPDDPGRLPVLTSDAFARHVGLTGDDDHLLLLRVGALLRLEPWGWKAASGSAGSWAFDISRRVRRFRDVTSVPHYVQLRSEVVEPSPAEVRPSADLPATDRRGPAPSGHSLTLVEWLTIVLAAVGTYLAGLQVHWQLPRTGSLVLLLTCLAFSAYSWRRGTDRRMWRHVAMWVTAVVSAASFIWSFVT
jgi:hypothetical protein